MIGLRHITKIYPMGRKKRLVLNDVSASLRPGLNVGILGRNGAGKSTLMRIIGGNTLPDGGRIIRTSKISWPIGFAGCFNGSLTGRENLRFVCRLYDRNWKDVSRFVEEFSELGDYMEMPVRTYSSGMGAKLAFGLSMAIGFEYYLIDEITAVGDASFQAKCQKVFDERKANSTLIVVSHNISTIKKHCDIAGILDGGKLHFQSSINDAVKEYNDICRRPPNICFAH